MLVGAQPGLGFGSISGTASEAGGGDEIGDETGDGIAAGTCGSHVTCLTTFVIVLFTVGMKAGHSLMFKFRAPWTTRHSIGILGSFFPRTSLLLFATLRN